MRLRPIIAALVALAALPAPTRAQQRDYGSWVGSRVVLQNGALLNDPKAGADAGGSRKTAAARDRGALRVCVVGLANGAWLWLRDEDGPAQGWVDASSVVPFERAVDFFTARIRAEPAVADNYVRRAAIREKRGELAEAIADLDEAIRLDPRGAPAHAARGRVRSARKEYDKAVADYTEAIRIDPDFAVAYDARGSARDEKKEYDGAVADYTEAIRIDPGYALAYNDRAWLRATCPDAKYRDGKAAVADATRACELDGWKTPDLVDTLAAAHAESGDFARAIEVQQKALALVKDGAASGPYRERLALYKAGKPYHDGAAAAVNLHP
jgi:tetratricopeptide (TPR) repeat protein